MSRKKGAERRLGPNAIRTWRENRNLTLGRLADRLVDIGLPITSASLSRIERGLQPYSQQVLEALADALRCEPADLIMRRPGSSDEIRLVDLVRALDDKEKAQAFKILRALSAA